ncbi:MAG: hypothetical protein ABJC61_10450 [Acidobacteriota bacterium]
MAHNAAGFGKKTGGGNAEGRGTSGVAPVYSKHIMATVKHLTRVKILESNNVSLRPGSVYDNATYFESLPELPDPGFNYEFIDSGLGAAEPLYPMYQKGHQGSYAQILPAAISEKRRHIDHYTSLVTPEGCQVDGAYLLRGIDEYPKDVLTQERKDGYTLAVTRLEYYTRLRPDAQCGRHRSNDPDPHFSPLEFLKRHHNAMSLKDFTQSELARFEAKFSVIYHLKQTMSPKWPRFDLNKLTNNSLWFYPNGHAFDYGIAMERPQVGLQWLKLPRHLIVEAPHQAQDRLPLESLLPRADFHKVLTFLSGRPTADFDPDNEPGHDTLRVSDVTHTNVYTSGLDSESIQTAVPDVSNPKNFRLVAMTIKPYEDQDDVSWTGVRVIPQIHFVYQMTDPRNPSRAFEQLYFHLKWDVVDRSATEAIRRRQHLYFLRQVDQLTRARETHAGHSAAVLADFVHEFTSARPVETVAFSSSLTGIWIFGSLTRNNNVERDLIAARNVRDGVDVGFYSSVYDNDVFRAEIARSTGERKKRLEKHMDDLTMGVYRDPKRQDVHGLNFNRVTCAQCHQTAGRDGVHVAFSDNLDRRVTAPINATEFFFHDADEQLKIGERYWHSAPVGKAVGQIEK